MTDAADGGLADADAGGGADGADVASLLEHPAVTPIRSAADIATALELELELDVKRMLRT